MTAGVFVVDKNHVLLQNCKSPHSFMDVTRLYLIIAITIGWEYYLRLQPEKGFPLYSFHTILYKSKKDLTNLQTVVRSQQASLVTFGVYTVDTHLANTVFTGSLLEVCSYGIGVVLVYAALTIIRESQADNLAEVWKSKKVVMIL